MGQKSSLKIIEEDFVGLDFTSSDLKKSTNFLKEALNCTYVETSGIQKRAGFEVVGGIGLFLGLDQYVYLDKETGETKTELLAFGSHVFKLTDAVLTITRTSGHFKVTKTYNGADTLIQFFPNNSIIPELTYTYKESEYSKDYPAGTVGDLCRVLVSSGIYTVSINKPAKIVTSTVLVNENVTGDVPISSYLNLPKGIFVSAYNRRTGLFEYCPIVDMLVAGTFTMRRRIKWGFFENDPIGAATGAIPTCKFPDPSSSNPSHNIPFEFWDGIRFSSSYPKEDYISFGYPFTAGVFEDILFYKTGGGKSLISSLNKPLPLIKGVNLNDKYYYCMPYVEGFKADGLPKPRVYISGKLMCYDKHCTYRAGLLPPEEVTNTFTIAPTSTVEKYQYMYTVGYLDANGVEWESEPSKILKNERGPTLGGTTISIQALEPVEVGNGLEHFDVRGFVVKTAGTYLAGTPIPVTGAFTSSPNITVGDKLPILDGSIPTKFITVTEYISSPTTATVKLDTDITAPSNSFVFSTGLHLNIYRTKAYGRIFYRVGEKRAIYKQKTLSFVDTIPDTDLKIEYIQPLSGEEHTEPPVCGKLTVHQGCLVTAGSDKEPNTIYWSGIDGVEYFPRAFNTIDVPSNITGNITGITSDGDNSLAVFKDRAYYSLDGDLASKGVSVRTIKEGDYGIAGQQVIAKIDGVITGVGSNGIVGVLNGVLDAKSVGAISPRLNNRRDLSFNRASAFNDYLNSQYILCIPSYTITNQVNNVIEVEIFILNYKNGKWLNWQHGSGKFDLSGGMAIYNNTLYALSRHGIFSSGLSGALFLDSYPMPNRRGVVIRQKSRDDNQCFNDFGLPIHQRIFTSFDSLGEPSLPKLFQKVLIWRIPADYLNETQSIPVDTTTLGDQIKLSAYFDWITNPSNPASKVSSVTTTFQDSPFVELNIKDQKARSIAIEIVNNFLNENMFISGIEIITDVAFGSESKKQSSVPRVTVSSGT